MGTPLSFQVERREKSGMETCDVLYFEDEDEEGLLALQQLEEVVKGFTEM